MKKIMLLMIIGFLVLGLAGCGSTEVEGGQENQASTEVVETGDVTLEMVNEFLNQSGDLGPGSIANPVAVIPFAHIDGPQNESDFYAFVNFEYQSRDYVKYQVTYLSCTCRSAAVNYWQTAYIELSLPSSKNPDDVVLRHISFDQDASGDYLAGFWGDSDPTPAGVTYEVFKDEYISFFNGKENSYLQTLSTMWDIDMDDYTAGEGREDFEIDTFTGSSVSTNNIIRIIDGMMDYHAENEFFQE
ncbi:hypothetical protein Amet_4707 [Alkaliphilus metalliredigens QYMF]|uniref:Uncharacterized protein n=1 Tax=Alkaliphilus metalliredigens (strain QYMF) TaxID=293826 RepID=A6TX57_ALKMQ|nr:hypothetical protein [Alkaliphilus metalliredigens]ABR50775.1 hypothetical protein Amet_4707 [Alkaliphilus metalliredigens QYMF]